jgi:hypothetical protein
LVIKRGQFAVKIPKQNLQVETVDGGTRTIGRLTPGPGDYDVRQAAIDNIERESYPPPAR